eukprot:5516652-Prymnesium_polylepis.1
MALATRGWPPRHRSPVHATWPQTIRLPPAHMAAARTSMATAPSPSPSSPRASEPSTCRLPRRRSRRRAKSAGRSAPRTLPSPIRLTLPPEACARRQRPALAARRSRRTPFAPRHLRAAAPLCARAPPLRRGLPPRPSPPRGTSCGHPTGLSPPCPPRRAAPRPARPRQASMAAARRSVPKSTHSRWSSFARSSSPTSRIGRCS